MLPGDFNTTVDVYIRTSTGRDSLNNPTYGLPVTGSGWSRNYAAMPCKLAFNQKKTDYAPTGERILPTGILYFPATFTVNPQDRIVTTNNIQYVVLGVVPAYQFGSKVDHYEAQVALP